jgi:peptidoglycan/LPS O-acetylase OafA/YrhL
LINQEENRIKWIESLKLLAALLVFTTHFLAEFKSELLTFWEEGELLYGISGKLAVSFFFLMSGFFAMKVKRDDAWKYITKRYLRLVLPVLLIETTVFVLVCCFKAIRIEAWLPTNMTKQYISFYDIGYEMFLKDVFLLDSNVVVTYWCNSMLLLGPIIVMLLHGLYDSIKAEGRNSLSLIIAFLIPAFIAAKTGNIWYTICLMGAVLYLIIQKKSLFFQWIWVKASLFILVFLCIRTPETEAGYFWKGMASSCLFLIVFYGKWIKRVLNKRFFHIFSQYSFEIYLLHTPVNLLIITFLQGLLENAGFASNMSIMIMYLLSLTLTITLSVGLQKTSDIIMDKVLAKTGTK